MQSRQLLHATLLLLGAVSASDAQSVSPERPTRPPACRYGPWSPVIALEEPGSVLRATRFPIAAMRASEDPLLLRAASSRTQGYVVGVAGYEAAQLTRDYPWERTWPPQLRVLGFDGSRHDGPPGRFWFAYPRAATDAAGVLHVVWAEPKEDVPQDFRSMHGQEARLRSVWYAQMRSGRWSQPQLIYRTQSISWDPLSASRLVVDRRDGLHIAFASDDSTSWGMVYLHAPAATHRTWRAFAWRREIPVGYVDLAVGGRDHVAIAFVSAIGSPAPRDNVLFVTESRDGGATWSEGGAVTTAMDEPAIEPHIFADSVGALQLVWTHQAIESFADGRIWHATRQSNETRFTDRVALVLHGATGASRAAVDACGATHLVVHAYREQRSDLQYARFADGRWSPLERPFSMPGSEPSLIATGHLVHMVWNVGPTQASQSSIPISNTVHATLPVRR
jgi:hypothetical protein